MLGGGLTPNPQSSGEGISEVFHVKRSFSCIVLWPNPRGVLAAM